MSTPGPAPERDAVLADVLEWEDVGAESAPADAVASAVVISSPALAPNRLARALNHLFASGLRDTQPDLDECPVGQRLRPPGHEEGVREGRLDELTRTGGIRVLLQQVREDVRYPHGERTRFDCSAS